MGDGFGEIRYNNDDNTASQTCPDSQQPSNRKGRPRIYENGAKQHEKEIKYSSTYYRENKGKKCICQYCDKEIVHIYRHQHLKSKTCQKIRAVKEQHQATQQALSNLADSVVSCSA